MIVWILVGLAVVLIIALIGMYNGLVRANVRVDEAWSDITVQLKRRFDLIPNLVNTVKGYAKHEAETLEKIAKERASAVKGEGSVKEAAEAENMLTGALRSVFAVAESNPDLKANENFKHLQEELVDTEDKIQAARRFYNGSARDLNIKVQTFPTNLFANILGFKSREFFELEGDDNQKIAEPVEVEL